MLSGLIGFGQKDSPRCSQWESDLMAFDLFSHRVSSPGHCPLSPPTLLPRSHQSRFFSHFPAIEAKLSTPPALPPQHSETGCEGHLSAGLAIKRRCGNCAVQSIFTAQWKRTVSMRPFVSDTSFLFCLKSCQLQCLENQS